MSAAISPHRTDPVWDHIARRDLGAAFDTVRATVADCFPDRVGAETWLMDDPDEDWRVIVVIRVLLPAATSDDALLGQRVRYHTELVRRLPLSDHPHFGLLVGFAEE